jgi:acyl-coenzyme A thioesterase PaaI-like protein
VILQRIFWNEKDQECVVVLYFGHGLDGWLSIVHGGALATVIDEALGRVALRSLPARTGVTANLNVTYRAPVSTGEFYSIHARLDEERSTERKAYVHGQIRSMTGKLCVEGSGLFVVPKNLPLRKVTDEF